MNYEGKIVKLLAVETVGQNNLTKRTIILEENRDSEYKGGVAVDFWGDKVEMLTNFKEGDIVEVGLNVKVREYNGRRYNSISGWKIEGKDGNGEGNSTESEPFVPPKDEDLPF